MIFLRGTAAGLFSSKRPAEKAASRHPARKNRSFPLSDVYAGAYGIQICLPVCHMPLVFMSCDKSGESCMREAKMCLENCFFHKYRFFVYSTLVLMSTLLVFPVVMYFFQKLPDQQRFQNINSTSTFLLFSGRYSLIVYSQEEGRLSYINLDQYKVFICSNQKSRQIFPPFIFFL